MGRGFHIARSGVDIGSSAIIACEVSLWLGRRLKTVAHHPLPTGVMGRDEPLNGLALGEALSEMRRDSGLGRRNVTMSLPLGKQSTLRRLELPLMTNAEVAEQLHWELESMDLEDVERHRFARQVLWRSTELQRMVVLVWAVHERVLRRYQKLARGGGLDVVRFVLDGAALQAWMSTTLPDAPPVYGFVHVGAASTLVGKISGAVLESCTVLPKGSDDVTRALAERLGVSQEQAEQLMREGVDPSGEGGGAGYRAKLPIDPKQIEEVMHEQVESLASAIDDPGAEIDGAAQVEPGSTMVLSGGGAALSGLAERLGRSFTVRRWDPTEGLPVSGSVDRSTLEEIAPGLGVALGLTTDPPLAIDALPTPGGKAHRRGGAKAQARSGWLVYGILGAAFFGPAAYIVIDHQMLVASSVRTTGTVAEVLWRTSSDGNELCYPLVEFQSSEGDEFSFEEIQATWPCPYEPGDPVSVLYDPTHPYIAQVDSPFWNVVLPSLFAVPGVIAIIAIALVRWHKRRQR